MAMFFSEEQETQALGTSTRECHDRREVTVAVVTHPRAPGDRAKDKLKSVPSLE